MKKTTWILVCDASRALLLEERPNKKGLALIESFDHAQSRLKVRDLMADASGRKPVGPVPARSGGGQGTAYGRPGAAPDTDPKEVEADKFAHELAHKLEDGLNQHAYDSLVIVAPAHFLGTMRSTVNNQVEKHIEGTFDKDFAGLPLPEISERLQQLRPAA